MILNAMRLEAGRVNSRDQSRAIVEVHTKMMVA